MCCAKWQWVWFLWPMRGTEREKRERNSLIRFITLILTLYPLSLNALTRNSFHCAGSHLRRWRNPKSHLTTTISFVSSPSLHPQTSFLQQSIITPIFPKTHKTLKILQIKLNVIDQWNQSATLGVLLSKAHAITWYQG